MSLTESTDAQAIEVMVGKPLDDVVKSMTAWAEDRVDTIERIARRRS